MSRFIILDRDGVINYESALYIKAPEEWHPIPRSLEAMGKASKAGFKLLIATNQSGVARNYYSLETLDAIHQKLRDLLSEHDGKITDIIFCPHHPDENCLCRKPKPGMLIALQQKHQFDFSTTFFIGDSWFDYEAAKQVNMPFILVLTGNGEKTREKLKDVPSIPIFQNLEEALEFATS